MTLTPVSELGERAQAVMTPIAPGPPNQLIADVLHLNVQTARVHRAKVSDTRAVASAVARANLLNAVRK